MERLRNHVGDNGVVGIRMPAQIPDHTQYENIEGLIQVLDPYVMEVRIVTDGGVYDVARGLVRHTVHELEVEGSILARGQRDMKGVIFEQTDAQQPDDGAERMVDIAFDALIVPVSESLDVVLGLVVYDGGRDGVLVGKVVVEERPRDTHALCDVLHGRVGETALLVEVAGCGDDLRLACVTAIGHCVIWIHRVSPHLPIRVLGYRSGRHRVNEQN